MHRTQIYLPEDLRRELAKISASTGESLSELLRKGAKQMIEQFAKLKKQKKTARQELDEIFAEIDRRGGVWGGDYDPIAERAAEQRRRDERFYGK